MIVRRGFLHGLVLLFLSLACGVGAQEANRPRTPTGQQKAHWVASWGASQQIPELRNALPADDLTDATMRQIVHLSLGGERLRVRLSNAFGTAALHLTAVHIAKPVSPASSSIVPGSDRSLTFGGAQDVTIPAGAEYFSDPIDYPMGSLSDLTITFYEEKPPAQETSHPGSRATTYYTHGNLVSAEQLPGAKTIEHWYTIAGLDVTAAPSAFSVVTLGDSITDGHAATTNGNDRWPDVLARNLQGAAKTGNVAVVNVGTGGNRLLTDGLGPNALARLDRDVLARAGVRYLMVLEGVNDLGTLHGVVQPGSQPPPPAETGTTQRGATSAAGTAGGSTSAQGEAAVTNGVGGPGSAPKQQSPAFHFPEATPEQHDELARSILAAYEQIVTQAHAAGIRVIGTTITPFGGSGYGRSTANEADRRRINAWILTPGNFDAVVDFARVIADPQDPTKMAAQFDSGDHLHPSPAGYRAMGESIPLALFVEP
jgi:lysophospholipase L1-like esterase